MPGIRPERRGPVWAVTACRTSTSVVDAGGFSPLSDAVGSALVTSPMVPARDRLAIRAVMLGRLRDVTDRPIGIHRGGPPETVLPEPPAEWTEALAAALAAPDTLSQRTAVKAVVARAPRFLDVWARLGQLAEDPVDAYACF